MVDVVVRKGCGRRSQACLKRSRSARNARRRCGTKWFQAGTSVGPIHGAWWRLAVRTAASRLSIGGIVGRSTGRLERQGDGVRAERHRTRAPNLCARRVTCEPWLIRQGGTALRGRCARPSSSQHSREKRHSWTHFHSPQPRSHAAPPGHQDLSMLKRSISLKSGC
jgi:hypothetical protein